MSNHTKIISLLLSVIMVMSVFGIVPFSAAAEEIDASAAGATSGTTGDCTWSLDGTVLTISGNGKMEDYWDGAPWGTDLTKVILTDGVTSIGARAFMEYTELATIIIPESVTSVGDDAFSYTAWYDNQPDGLIYVGKVAYRMKGECPSEITLKDDTVSIGNGIFGWSENLKKINIPDSVITIDEYAFFGCRNLESIIIPDSVTSIGSNAFAECTELKSITISESVTSVGDDAFSGTAWYYNQPDGLIYVGKVAYGVKGDCPPKIIIKDNTTSINDDAFYWCDSLKSVIIPDSVITIGKGAFRGCTGLESIFIPASVISIGENAFDSTCMESIVVDANNTVYDSRNNCNAIIKTETNELICGSQNTVIPDSVTSIGEWAFSGCTGLTSVTIPDTVTYIGASAFYGCINLSEIIMSDAVTSLSNTTFSETAWYDLQPDGMIYAGKVAYDIKGDFPEKISIKEGTIAVANRAVTDYSLWRDPNLKEVNIPNSVRRIGFAAFSNHINLKSVMIPYSVKEIDDYAFGYYNMTIETVGNESKIKDFTIYGYTGSEAERYANDNGFTFIALDDEPKAGDADGDGEISSIDATYVQRYCAQMDTGIDEDILMNADIDSNGYLEVIDATWIQRWLADMEIPYTIG